MSDLSEALTDAAAAAIGAAVHMPGSRAQAREAVAAVLETLAERSAVMERAHDGWGVFDADELLGLAAEVKAVDGDG